MNIKPRVLGDRQYISLAVVYRPVLLYVRAINSRERTTYLHYLLFVHILTIFNICFFIFIQLQ